MRAAAEREQLRARRDHCGTSCARSSGRWRARRWRRSPGRSSTSLGLARKDDQAAVQLFLVRNGKMVGRDVFLLEAPRDTPDDEVVRSFLDQYYATATNIPREVLVPRALADVTDLEDFLTAKRGSRAPADPQRGEKRELMELATRNADETLAREQARWLADEGKTQAALDELGLALGLPAPPTRIECYDISNFQGSEYGRQHGRVRGRPSALWRVPPIPGPDRAGTERLREPPGSAPASLPPGKSGEEGNAEERRWSMPDLVIIDGGKGQVERGQGGPRRARAPRPPARGPGEGARGAVPPGRNRADPPPDDLTGSLPGPAAARRGAPVRDRLPPPAAGEAPGALGVR